MLNLPNCQIKKFIDCKFLNFFWKFSESTMPRGLLHANFHFSGSKPKPIPRASESMSTEFESVQWRRRRWRRFWRRRRRLRKFRRMFFGLKNFYWKFRINNRIFNPFLVATVSRGLLRSTFDRIGSKSKSAAVPRTSEPVPAAFWSMWRRRKFWKQRRMSTGKKNLHKIQRPKIFIWILKIFI